MEKEKKERRGKIQEAGKTEGKKRKKLMHSSVMVSEQTFCTNMAAILNHIDLREYQGAPQQYEYDLIYSLSIYTCFLAQFFLKGKKIKIAVPCFDVIMITFFPKNMQKRFLFARKSCINTERVPPWVSIKYGHNIGKKVYSQYYDFRPRCKKTTRIVTLLQPF